MWASAGKGVICRPRAILEAMDAIEIYKHKYLDGFDIDPLIAGNATKVAEMFNVSPKTIRDIWNRRTWIPETQHLWMADDKPSIRKRRSGSSIKVGGEVGACQFKTGGVVQLLSTAEKVSCKRRHSELEYWSTFPDTRFESRQDIGRQLKLERKRQNSGESLEMKYQLHNGTDFSLGGSIQEISCGPPIQSSCSSSVIGDLSGIDPFHFDWPYW
jgi:hypothetical protein